MLQPSFQGCWIDVTWEVLLIALTLILSVRIHQGANNILHNKFFSNEMASKMQSTLERMDLARTCHERLPRNGSKSMTILAMINYWFPDTCEWVTTLAIIETSHAMVITSRSRDYKKCILTVSTVLILIQVLSNWHLGTLYYQLQNNEPRCLTNLFG